MRRGEGNVALLFDVVLETAFRRSEIETQGTEFDRCCQIMAYIDGAVLWEENYGILQTY